jgi:DNA mismatch endonuclease, patch repair protein
MKREIGKKPYYDTMGAIYGYDVLSDASDAKLEELNSFYKKFLSQSISNYSGYTTNMQLYTPIIFPSPAGRAERLLDGKVKRLNARPKIYSNTTIECLLQAFLRLNNIEFREQYSMGFTIIDIAILDRKIAIYADGCYWHGCPQCFPDNKYSDRNYVDDVITQRLRNLGWRVIRLWEHDIMSMVGYPHYSPKELSTVLYNC